MRGVVGKDMERVVVEWRVARRLRWKHVENICAQQAWRKSVRRP